MAIAVWGCLQCRKSLPKIRRNQCFRQVDGVSRISMGNSSRRPKSISAVRTILARGEKTAKLPVGPTKIGRAHV